jgi:hypothetical protein
VIECLLTYSEVYLLYGYQLRKGTTQMTKRHEATLWTVRNKSGQYLATYRAFTAEQAINKVLEDDRRIASTFRRSQPSSMKREGLTATPKAES